MAKVDGLLLVRSFRGNHALLDRQSGGLHAVLEMKFRENIFEMVFYRVLGDI